MNRITNSESWTRIFKKFNILEQIKINGYYNLSADDIKSVDGKEARLMAKIDFKHQLPYIMSQNNLSILAITNGLYKIAKTNVFLNVNKEIQTNIIKIDAPLNIISINYKEILGESAALDIAHLSGMTKLVFNEESVLTIRGRRRSKFSFKLNSIDYDVNGVQIEVDGGYESSKSINLIEAKIGYNDHISIRQLMYPHLAWTNEIRNLKQVKSYLFMLDDNVYRFIPYEYELSKINEQNYIGILDHANEKAFQFN